MSQDNSDIGEKELQILREFEQELYEEMEEEPDGITRRVEENIWNLFE